MEITAITQAAKALAPQFAAPIGAISDFGQWMAQELSSVNDKLTKVDESVQNVALGGPGTLHDAMIQIEDARLSFDLLVQVRNKALEAYQELMRTQA